MTNLMTRRAWLSGTAATAAIGLSAGSALGKAPMTNRPAPAFYRFKVGAFEATIVSDGPLNLGPPQPDVFKGVSKEELTQALANNFMPTDQLILDQNVLVVNTGRHLVLFDTGTGRSLKAFGPNVGRLLANLRAAGIDPNNVDAIAITHAHPDHCFGLMSESGRRNFPRAQIYLTQADLEFWTDDKNAINDLFKQIIAGTRKQLLPNRNRIVLVKDGQEVVPGVQAMATPGHTVGHTSYVVTSQKQTLCNLGDLAHHHAISMERPRVEFAYDTDGKQAVASRLKTFDMLATERIQMVSYHFPWPGLGYVAKQGEGYRYYPAPLRTML